MSRHQEDPTEAEEEEPSLLQYGSDSGEDSKGEISSPDGKGIKNNASTEEKLKYLEEKFPASTPNERLRFLTGKKFNVKHASNKLGDYLKFRADYELDQKQTTGRSSGDDHQDWEEASKQAMEWGRKHQPRRHKSKKCDPGDVAIPQILFLAKDPETGEPARTLDGSLIIQVLPGRVKRFMATGESYALAMALYIDRKFGRDSLDTGTLFLDVRPGEGWQNPKPITMVPFIKITSKFLTNLYPRRLNQCLLFPVPKVIPVVWDMVRPALDKDIVKRVMLIGSEKKNGNEKRNARPPNEKLKEFTTMEMLDQLEEHRMSLYDKEKANQNEGSESFDQNEGEA